MLRTSSLMLVAAAFCLVSITGCGQSPESKLVGKWELDVDVLSEKLEAEISKKMAAMPEGMPQFDEAIKEKMKEQMLASKLTLDFQKDGKVIFAGGPANEREEGTWKVSKVEGDTLTLLINTGEKEEAGQVTLVGSDKLELRPPEGQGGFGSIETLPFVRVK